jgi:hypothetical protein
VQASECARRFIIPGESDIRLAAATLSRHSTPGAPLSGHLFHIGLDLATAADFDAAYSAEEAAWCTAAMEATLRLRIAPRFCRSISGTTARHNTKPDIKFNESIRGRTLASMSHNGRMIDSMAADLRGTGVRRTRFCQSIIDTEANRKARPGADYSKWPKPQDIARVILFLCSDDARLIHGASVPL